MILFLMLIYFLFKDFYIKNKVYITSINKKSVSQNATIYKLKWKRNGLDTVALKSFEHRKMDKNLRCIKDGPD